MTKTDEEECYSKDRISQLPDDILIPILSRMTLREAAGTYVLSTRWQTLWADVTSMNFDATDTMFDIQWDPKLWRIKMPSYISFVNQVLKMHRNPTIVDFRVCFHLNDVCKFDIDRWLEFALTKSTQRLEMDFKRVQGAGSGAYGENYRFSNNCYEYIRSPQGLLSIRLMTYLCLRCVNVSGEILEHFLSNCPFLKELAVEKSKDLVNLKVGGGITPLPLQRLDISWCSCLEKLEIYAPLLVSLRLRHFGPSIDLSIRDVTLLVDVSISGVVFSPSTLDVSSLSSYLCKMETLTLRIDLDCMKLVALPELTSLKTLNLELHSAQSESFIELSPLINTCPSINQLRFKLFTWNDSTKRRLTRTSYTNQKPHGSLRIVEMVGFVGCKLDLEIAQYLLDTAKVLEKIIIDCRWAFGVDRPKKYWIGKDLDKAKKHALKLKEKDPSKIEVLDMESM